MEDIPLDIMLIALIISLILSGFFSLSETSMMAINRYRLKHLVKQGHRLRRAVAGDGNLAIPVMQLVKGVAKALLGLLLTADKADVINQ